MEHIIIREAAESDCALEYAKSTPDGNLIDLDVFKHQSSFLLEALRSNPQRRGWTTDRMAYLPVQQPLMLENLLFRPALNDRERAQAMTRLTEHVITEAYRRDVGELYFLCRHEETCKFAENHLFRRIDGEQGLGLKVYRMNLLETFGQ